MKQNQKGVSMVSLVITIIVIIILAAVAFSGSEETIGRSGFSGYVTDIDSVRTAFMTEGIPTLMGEEETKNNTVTKAQAYNYLARGINTNSYSKAEKKSAWLSKSQAANIPCTEIEKETAKDAIGIKLPKRKVNTFDASGIEISYFVTNKGDIFTWPPYYRSDDGLFYVNDTIYVRGSKVTSGDWIISGDDEAEMYKDGFAFMVNGVEIKVLGSEDDILEIRPDTTVEEIRTMMSVAYKDEKNAESPIGIKFTNDLYADGGNTGTGGDVTGSEGNEGGGDENPDGPENSAELNPDDGTTPQNGEMYKYGDYMYMYDETLDGWMVGINPEVTDTNQERYGDILESINGKPLKCLYYTFHGCSNLVEAPSIPSTVVNLDYAFAECESLINPPNLSKITDLEILNGTFSYCTSLKSTSNFPSKLQDMTYAFCGCTALENVSAIPSSVTNMYSTFTGCTALTNFPDMSNASNLTNMYGTFQMCTSVVDASNLVIPSSVTDISCAFINCTSLTGTIEINATPNTYEYCFEDVNFENQNLKLTGSSTKLDLIGATGRGYCAECNGKCLGNH